MRIAMRVPTAIRCSLFLIMLVSNQRANSQESYFTDLYVFGASLSDTGNYHALYGSPGAPYFEARFSNGPVTVDLLADGLGLPWPIASLRGGNNYAYSAAATGPGSNGVNVVSDPPRTVPNYGAQIDEFLAGGGQLGPRDLIYIDSPSNDRFLNVSSTTVEENLKDHVQTLYEAGGRYFILNNLAVLGFEADLLNNAVDRVASQLNSDLADVSIGVVYSNEIIRDIFLAPLQYGFTNGSFLDNGFPSACANCEGLIIQDGPFEVAADPNTYVLWDSAHPTTRYHEIVADETLRVAALMVPEPTLCGTFVAAMIGIVSHTRRRRRT